MDRNYEVTKGESFNKFYAKAFQKKYHSRWEVTCDSLEQLCKRVDNIYDVELCDVIKKSGTKRLLKIDFAVAKSGESPKSSGCRLIAVSDDENFIVKMLLVYCKADIVHINNNETLAWKSLLSDLYPEFRDLAS